MTTIILLGVLLIGVLGAAAAASRAINGPQVEKQKTAQEQEATKQTTVNDETREDIVKARLSFRLQRRFWRLFGDKGAAPIPPELDPKPNRQI